MVICGTGHKRLVLQCVSALSDKRQQWQEPGPCPASYLYQREVRLGESVSLERSGGQRRNEAEEADEEDGMLEYDSSSSEDLDDESFSTNYDDADDDFGGRWIARQLFCLKRFHVSEELVASIGEL